MDKKICGLRRPEDIAMVNDANPSHVGFVFAPSKRQVSMEEARQLRSMLRGEIRVVGVFVNEPLAQIMMIYEQCNLDVVQLHGEEEEALIQQLQEKGIEVWKAWRVKDEKDIQSAYRSAADRVLLDTYVADEYGGSGKQFDWSLLENMPEEWIRERVWIAGGLDAENVSNVLLAIQPCGVDVSSGVETDGYKDKAKVTLFCKNC